MLNSEISVPSSELRIITRLQHTRNPTDRPKSLSEPLKPLKTKLEDLKGNWVEYLPEVLWAYRTTQKSATRETLIALAFGTETVAPVEVGLKTPRIELAAVEHNDEARHLNLDLLDEKREQVLRHTEDYQRKTMRYYNQKVKPRSYMPDDLVLKKLLP